MGTRHGKASTAHDLIVKNVRLVRPRQRGAPKSDIAIRNGKFVRIAPEIPATSARKVIDGRGQLAFPGLVDPHMHCGIYGPLAKDARTESLAAAQGGVTSSLNYMRTGGYYMERGGPYAEVFPEVLRQSKGNFWVDYAYHLAPIERRHIGEIDMLVRRFGVTSFKIFMFYGGFGLHGASDSQRQFLKLGADDQYDVAHFEFVMRGVERAMRTQPKIRDSISLSLHCEFADILNAYSKMVERGAKATDLDTWLTGRTRDPACRYCQPLTGLRAYSASRPPHSEGLAVAVASYLANETNCVNINLLHLSSRAALDSAIAMKRAFPHVDFRREVTIGHLCLDFDTRVGVLAKVNPPIRSRADVDYLWEKLLEGEIDWVCSDHACCQTEMKIDAKSPKDVFLAKSGFGGTEFMLPALITEGKPRGLSYNRMAELLSWNAARRFGLGTKGDIAPGFDADLVLVDPRQSFVASGALSRSSQGYSVFEGMEMKASVTSTFLRGRMIYDNGAPQGKPSGQYLHRPVN